MTGRTISHYQIGEKLGEGGIVHTAVACHTVARPLLELIQVPTRFRNSDDRNFQIVMLDQPLQRRENLLVSQVPGRAEKDQRIRVLWV